MIKGKQLGLYPLLIIFSGFIILSSLFWGAFGALADQGNEQEQKDQNNEMNIGTSPSSAFIGGSNMAPGDRIQSTVEVQNEGQLDFEYTVTARKQSGSQLLYDRFVVQVEHENEIVFNGSLEDLQQIKLGFLANGEKHELMFTVDFPLYAGNEYQGLETIIAFDFEAQGIVESGERTLTAEDDEPGERDERDDQDITSPVISQSDDTGTGSSIPDTATNWYNLLLVGVILLIIGIYLLWKHMQINRSALSNVDHS